MKKFIKTCIDTYRDIVTLTVVFLWIIGDMIELMLTDICLFNNIFWIFVMTILIIKDRRNPKFRKWLNTSPYKNKTK